jgi:uncharacterized RmlC-like cupin family protein
MSFLLSASLLALCGAVAVAANSTTVVMNGQEQWKPQPGNYEMATLYGDPSKSGFYVIRLKVPANWSFPAHYHPGRENATVISGTFYVGFGTKLDKSKVTAYTAGSFASIPPKLPHYALTKSDGAVVQVEGEGPFGETIIK